MKRIQLVLMSIFLLMILAACSSTNTTTDSSEEANDTNNETTSNEEESDLVEIEFWYSVGGKGGELIEAKVEEFNSSQEEVMVQATYQGDYYENHAKVMAAIAGNTQPDVTMVEIASVGAFADAGALEDLSTYVEGSNGIDMNDFVDGLLGNSYWKDTLYAMPFNRSTPIMYLNKDLLEEAGLDPAGPKTWDELKEYARALTKDGRYGFSVPIDIWFYEALTFQNNGQILSEDGKEPRFNSPEGIGPVEFWKEMIDEGIMKMPPGEKYNAWEVTNQDFINGNVAMIFTTTGYLNMLMESVPFELNTAFLPAKEDYGVPTGGANLVMLAKSEKKEAAWEFMKFMTSTDVAVEMVIETGYMPTRHSAVESEKVQALFTQTPQFKVAVDQLQYGNPRPMVPAYKELQEVIMVELQRAVLEEGVTAKQALDQAAERAQQMLK